MGIVNLINSESYYYTRNLAYASNRPNYFIHISFVFYQFWTNGKRSLVSL